MKTNCGSSPESQTAESGRLENFVSPPVVVLAWAQKKRHIAVNGKVLCEPKHSRHIRQRGESGYNSLSINGIPDYGKKYNDVDYGKGRGGSHHDGIIPFKPLNEIGGIIERSICNKCKARYEKLLAG